MWLGFFIVAGICVGVGFGVDAHVKSADQNKEVLKAKDDGGKQVQNPNRKKGPASKNGKLKQKTTGGKGNNRKVSIHNSIFK